MRPRRTSSRRARYGTTQSPSPAADRISPRNMASAVVHVSTAADGSPALRNADASSARRSTSSASTALGSTSSVYPALVPVTSAGSPNARRNRDTFVCSTLRAVPTASSAQRSSINRSVRTITPASRARRTSTSVVLPGRTAMRSPSRCSSTTSSTDTAITTHRVRPGLRDSAVSGVPPSLHPCPPNPTT